MFVDKFVIFYFIYWYSITYYSCILVCFGDMDILIFHRMSELKNYKKIIITNAEPDRITNKSQKHLFIYTISVLRCSAEY